METPKIFPPSFSSPTTTPRHRHARSPRTHVSLPPVSTRSRHVRRVRHRVHRASRSRRRLQTGAVPCFGPRPRHDQVVAFVTRGSNARHARFDNRGFNERVPPPSASFAIVSTRPECSRACSPRRTQRRHRGCELGVDGNFLGPNNGYYDGYYPRLVFRGRRSLRPSLRGRQLRGLRRGD